MKERIQKILANAGVDSRRNVEQMVRDGRVTVNGKTLTELPVLVDPARDKIAVDGERVKLKEATTDKRYYFILNKPKGVYCTNVAQGAQVRAIDLMPKNLPCRLYPVGRLDSESKGLLLMTNDGDLTNHLTHPRYGVAKTYRAVVDGNVDLAAAQQLETGIWMAEKEGPGLKTGRSRLRVVHHGWAKSTLEITIREGRERQVRRTLAKLGHKVRELIRTRMGPLDLHGLAPGQFRPLTGKEVRLLRELAKGRKGEGPRAHPGRAEHSEIEEE